MNKTEKERRSKIKREIKQKERGEILDSLPLSLEMLQNCFNFIDSKLSDNGCDDTQKFVLQFIEQNNLPKDDVIEWLRNNGGYCDCEVLANVESEINDK